MSPSLVLETVKTKFENQSPEILCTYIKYTPDNRQHPTGPDIHLWGPCSNQIVKAPISNNTFGL
jgi:hypothetical protein